MRACILNRDRDVEGSTDWSTKGATVSMIESRSASGDTPLSRRAMFDIATLITAGVASTAFFLLPLWTSLDRSRAIHTTEQRQLAVARPPVETSVVPSIATVSVVASTDARRSVPAPRQRSAIRSARAPRPAPAALRTKRETPQPQSKLARLLLGNGSDTVRPFPIAAPRSAR